MSVEFLLPLPLSIGAVSLPGEVPFEGEGEGAGEGEPEEGSVPLLLDPPTGGLTPCLGPGGSAAPGGGNGRPIWFGSRQKGCEEDRSPPDWVPVGGAGAMR